MIGRLLDVGVVAMLKLLDEDLGALAGGLALGVCVSFSSGGDGDDLSLPLRMEMLGDLGDLNESSWLFLLSSCGEGESVVCGWFFCAFLMAVDLDTAFKAF